MTCPLCQRERDLLPRGLYISTAALRILQRLNPTCGDFEAIDLSPSDFIYADPPFDDGFTQYAKGGFTWDDQIRLAEWLVRHPGPVVLSNKATPRIMELYEGLGFELERLEAPRKINCTGDRTPAAEVLALSNIY